METNMNNYWTYCGIQIPTNIKSVPSIDGVNIRYSDGSETERVGINTTPFTLEEYQNKHSIAAKGDLFWNQS